MNQDIDYTKLTKAQLKVYLKERGLKVSGNKSDLIARLQTGTDLPKSMATPRPKTKSTKSPVEFLKTSIRNADQTLEVAISALLSVYSAEELYNDIVELIGDRKSSGPVSLPVPTTYSGLKELKVADLKKILKERGEKVGGKKEELIQRIMNPTSQEDEAPMALPVESEELQLPQVEHNALPSVSVPAVPGVPAAEIVAISTPTSPEMSHTTLNNNITPSPLIALPVVPTLPMVSLPPTGGSTLPTSMSPPIALPGVPTLPLVDTDPTVPSLPLVDTDPTEVSTLPMVSTPEM